MAMKMEMKIRKEKSIQKFKFENLKTGLVAGLEISKKRN